MDSGEQHDYLVFARDGRDLSPEEANGYGDPPFGDDLVDAIEGAWVPTLLGFEVARALTTRARLFPSWMLALACALWRLAPEVSIREAVGWALATRSPASYASALVVVYTERRRMRSAAGLSGDGIELRRLLLASMRDLGDAHPAVLPDEARNY